MRAIINVGTSEKTSRKAIEIANEYEKGVYFKMDRPRGSEDTRRNKIQGRPPVAVYASVSLHPIYASKEFNYDKFLDMARDKKVVAIGETGLDYWHIQNDKERQKDYQKKLFKLHLDLAKEMGKPLILHCRNAKEDFMKILDKYAPDFKSGQMRGVVHCFSGDSAFAKAILDLNLFISFTGIITYPKNEELCKVIHKIPLDKMMIETDSPYIAPQAFRGKRNEPAYVLEIAKKIAELKNISVEEVANQTTKNAVEFFGIQLFDDGPSVDNRSSID